jgi:hypothetical protein
MRKTLIIAICLLSMISCRESSNPSDPETNPNKSGTEIQGSISGVLQKKDSPFYVVNDIYIDSMNTLTIEAGVKLAFYDSTTLKIRGTIISVGDKTEFINFTSHSNSWFGIEIRNSKNYNEFQYCNINNVNVYDTEVSEYGVVTIFNSHASIKNCIFSDNYSVNGGGISIVKSEIELKNNIFIDNFAAVFGGAIISIESITKIYNNTIFRNTSYNYGGGIVLVNPIFDDIQNNILYLNSSQSGDPSVSVNSGDSTNYNSKYNFLWYSDLSPKFISEDDLKLQVVSPCIDQGNPNSEFNDHDCTRNDQGAYGGPNGDW